MSSADVEQTGATTAPAHTLYDIVRKLPEGAEVSFEVAGDNGRMTLAAGRSNFALTTLPKEDFPAVGDGVLPQSFAMAASELKNLIDRTRFAISTEETRYYLNGIYLHAASTGDLAGVAGRWRPTGTVWPEFEMPLPEGAADMPAVIVPRKTVGELRKLIDEIGGSVEISLSETQIRFAFADTVLTSKLIDGTFPDYERVIPSGNDKVMDVDRKSFFDAVDRVSTISTEKSRAVKLALDNGVADGVRHQSRKRQRRGGAGGGLWGRSAGNRLQLAISAGHRPADRRRRSSVRAGRFLFADDRAGPGGCERPLRAHAHASMSMAERDHPW